MALVSVLLISSLVGYAILASPHATGESLSAQRVVGTGTNDFWTTYPALRTDSGKAVTHPAWVLNALDHGPVLIFIHLEDCMACAVQAPICTAVNASHQGQITYFDLLGGRDDAAMGDGLVAYDPTGGSQLVPLTVVVDRVIDVGGASLIIWHSWEGIISEASLDSWTNDAVSHYQKVL